MIALHVLQLYNASLDLTVTSRSGDLVYFNHGDNRFVSNVWCNCAAAEFAVIDAQPDNAQSDVALLRVCAKHGDYVGHGRRLKSEIEREAEYAQVAAVRKQLNVDFSVKHRAGVIAWGDPRWSKKSPEVKS